jgi:hypothetical protein
MVLRHWVAWKELEGAGRPWNDLRHRAYRGLRPINTAYLPTVDSVVENIDSQLQQGALKQLKRNIISSYLRPGKY